jgi:2-amino-4-hydroxy-6-hydroxymethyldihydropteridine diphosphokinase
MSETAYVGFGANLGDRVNSFHRAVDLLGNAPKTSVIRVSQLYETRPVGLSDNGPNFINAVIESETGLTPENFMKELQKIESTLGKNPAHRSDLSRSVDLDLLLFGDRIINEEGLKAPHPRMALRAFTLIPLKEIAGEVIHPELGVSISELASRLRSEDLLSIWLYNK